MVRSDDADQAWAHDTGTRSQVREDVKHGGLWSTLRGHTASAGAEEDHIAGARSPEAIQPGVAEPIPTLRPYRAACAHQADQDRTAVSLPYRWYPVNPQPDQSV